MYNVSFPALGLEFTIDRVAFSVAGFDIYWYALCITAGLLLGIMYFIFAAKKFGFDPDKGIDVLIVGGIAAVIGARLYYVIFSPFPIESFMDIINIRNGGLAIYGAVIAAFAVAIPMCKLRKVPVLPLFDAVAIGFLIGQGVGRWGNFFNQEAFGTNTTSLFGMYSEGTNYYLSSAAASLALQGITVDPSMPVHPTFLYESIWCIVCFVGLAIYAKHRKFNGEIFLWYLFLYGLERSVVEGLRTDSLMIMNARVSQLLAILLTLAAAGTLIYFYLTKHRRTQAPFALLPEFVPVDKDEEEEKLAAEKEKKDEKSSEETVIKNADTEQENDETSEDTSEENVLEQPEESDEQDNKKAVNDAQSDTNDESPQQDGAPSADTADTASDDD